MANKKEIEAAKRAIKHHPKAVIITIVAIILIIAIAFCVLYFGFPKTWDSLMSSFRGEDDPNNGLGGDGGSGAGGSGPSGGLQLGEDELKIHFINVGQGDCIYIQFPDGTDMIIDCGNKSTGYDYADTQKYLNDVNPDGKINHLMLTHCDEDHVDNLDEIIYDFEIENIYMPNVLAVPKNSKGESVVALQEKIDDLDRDLVARFDDKDVITTQTYANFFIAALSEENCTIHLTVDPDENTNSIVIEESTYRLTFYCPTQEYYNQTGFSNGKYDGTSYKEAEYKNAISPIGILEYNGRRVVLTGDSNQINEPIFVRRINGSLDCDVLKVGHHGSETSSLNPFLDAITCEYAVISCNMVGNTYSHPRQAALDRLAAHNMTVYRTDKNGTVVLTIDGDGEMTFSVETEVSQEVILIGADTEKAQASSLFAMPLLAGLCL